MIQGRKTQTEALISQVVQDAAGTMQWGSISFKILGTLESSVDDGELTAVMSIAPCKATHSVAAGLAEMGKLQLAITGN